jgi:hypothetical protein
MRVIVVVLGAIFLVIGALGIIGGLLVYNLAQQGFTIKPDTLKSNSHAIVLTDIDLGSGEDYSWAGLRIGPDEFVTLTLTGESLNPDKDFFVGLAEESAAEAYLDDVEYDELTGADWTEVSPFQTTYADFGYNRIAGQRDPADPTTQTFWEIKEHGDGSREIEWDVQPGIYWGVLMNEDHTRDIEADIEINIKIPDLLTFIATILLVAGAFFAGIGSVLVYIGTRPPTPTGP